MHTWIYLWRRVTDQVIPVEKCQCLCSSSSYPRSNFTSGCSDWSGDVRGRIDCCSCGQSPGPAASSHSGKDRGRVFQSFVERSHFYLSEKINDPTFYHSSSKSMLYIQTPIEETILFGQWRNFITNCYL